ncbi:MAG: hypothetical protein ACPG5B_04960 [Chitinophagales bacterium]
MKKEYVLLEAKETAELLTIPMVISVIEKCFAEKATGNFLALPKINIAGENGSLRITAGESRETFKAIGFRLYDVIRNDFSVQPQLNVVYDNETGRLKGIVISQLLGAYRTAAINAVMQSGFQTKGINALGVVGTGYQARIHLEAFVYALEPKKVLVYGRTKANLQIFLAEMRAKLGHKTEILACESIHNLAHVDSLLLATRSKKPLISPKIFKNKMVITTIGPKTREKSEVSNDFAETCDLIVTDSKEQVEKYGDNFFMHDLSKVYDYTDFLKNENLKPSQNAKILLCSVGMGGTEVAIANELIEKKQALNV